MLLLLMGFIPICGAQYNWRISAGKSVTGEVLDSVRTYKFWQGSAGIAWPLTREEKAICLYGVADLQFAITDIRSNGRRDFDIGINVTLEMIWQMIPGLTLQLAAGSGPAYQSSVSTIQARGYVFSNNLMAGLRWPVLKGKLLVNPQFRFRHLSNAATRNPNIGIDNFIGVINFCIPFHPQAKHTLQNVEDP
jgi:hypothetical protein